MVPGIAYKHTYTRMYAHTPRKANFNLVMTNRVGVLIDRGEANYLSPPRGGSIPRWCSLTQNQQNQWFILRCGIIVTLCNIMLTWRYNYYYYENLLGMRYQKVNGACEKFSPGHTTLTESQTLWREERRLFFVAGGPHKMGSWQLHAWLHPTWPHLPAQPSLGWE